MLKRYYRFITIFILLFNHAAIVAASSSRHFPQGVEQVQLVSDRGIRADTLQEIAPLIKRSIKAGDYPGAVVLVGHRGKVVYQGVFGNRRIEPDVASMMADTIFDVASLTKVLVTTPAIMQLVERGKISLDAPVSRYWPAFAAQQKQSVTIRHLLTHTSGLPADISVPDHSVDQAIIMKKIADLSVKYTPGSQFLYSDVNFVVLGYIVELVSKQSLDRYAADHLFKPLKMNHTSYLPAKEWRDDIAPVGRENNRLRWGAVQDPIANALGGVAGHAGVFSNATDLARYAQSILDGGKLPEVYSFNQETKWTHFLGPLAIRKMTSPQTPASVGAIRGLGWDIASPYSNRGVLLASHSFGHTGWTGASLWIDPTTQTWIIFLTSRLHPTPAHVNQVIEDRKLIANIVSASIIDTPMSGPDNTGVDEFYRAFPQIKPGAEQTTDYLPLLKNKKVGIFVNQTSVINGKPLLDVLMKAGVNVTTIFTPEHGYKGVVDDGLAVNNDKESHYGIPIISLYGKHVTPDSNDLANVDVLLFDIQDVGVRFYTYLSSLQRLMEAAIIHHKPLIVLDRPNPNGFYVDGPVLDTSMKKLFTGLQPIPVVYGMTIGEYANMLVGEQWLEVTPKSRAKELQLTIIPAKDYTHDRLYVPPIPPSPNLPSIQSIYWYPSIGLMEGMNISVGRGTKQPFLIFGHPKFKAPFSFKPHTMPGAQQPPFKEQLCYGWNLTDAPEKIMEKIDRKLQIKYMMMVSREYQRAMKIARIPKAGQDNMIHSLSAQIEAGWSEQKIRQSWEPALGNFKAIRKKYLLYPDFKG